MIEEKQIFQQIMSKEELIEAEKFEFDRKAAKAYL